MRWACGGPRGGSRRRPRGGGVSSYRPTGGRNGMTERVLGPTGSRRRRRLLVLVRSRLWLCQLTARHPALSRQRRRAACCRAASSRSTIAVRRPIGREPRSQNNAGGGRTDRLGRASQPGSEQHAPDDQPTGSAATTRTRAAPRRTTRVPDSRERARFPNNKTDLTGLRCLPRAGGSADPGRSHVFWTTSAGADGDDEHGLRVQQAPRRLRRSCDSGQTCHALAWVTSCCQYDIDNGGSSRHALEA